MLSKSEISLLKNSNNGEIRDLIYKNIRNNSFILNILKNLGKLSDGFDGEWLVQLSESKNNNIRLLAVKNIGKLCNEKYLGDLKSIAENDNDTNVRREAVSAIGRMRNEKAKNILLDFLNDEDPKIVCQAIRGLLVFKGDKEIDENLKLLLNHINETVRSIIEKEYFPKINKTSKQAHNECYEYLKDVIVCGDTIEVMKLLQNESVHLTFTSPPYYNARDYSIYPSYETYINFLVKVFKEVHRITKEGRFLVLNTSPIIIPRISRGHSSKRYPIPFDIHHHLIEMGWEFIDDIIWEKPEASVKNRIAGFMQHRKPLAYKPNSVTEYIMVYRKKTDKLIDWNIRQYDFETVNKSRVSEGYETTNIWKIEPKSDKIHSAVFPPELCKRVIQYYSFKNDLIFDPFAGSGTVGRTAKYLGRYFLLTENSETYFKYMHSLKSDDLYDRYPSKFFSLEEFKKTIK